MNLSIDAEYIIDSNKKTKVLLPVEEYSKIIELLKNYDITITKHDSIENQVNNSDKKVLGDRIFGSAKGKYILSPDFDEPFENFDELV